jgi:hypothetical protein
MCISYYVDRQQALMDCLWSIWQPAKILTILAVLLCVYLWQIKNQSVSQYLGNSAVILPLWILANELD